MIDSRMLRVGSLFETRSHHVIQIGLKLNDLQPLKFWWEPPCLSYDVFVCSWHAFKYFMVYPRTQWIAST